MHTTCPECSSVFRVNAHQLNAARGQVRCGYCQTVFEAVGNLEDDWNESLANTKQQTSLPVNNHHSPPLSTSFDSLQDKIKLDELLSNNDKEPSLGKLPDDDQPTVLSAQHSTELFDINTSNETDFIKQKNVDIKRQTETLFGQLARQLSPKKDSNIEHNQIVKDEPKIESAIDTDPPDTYIEPDDTPEILREELAAITAKTTPSYTYVWFAGIVFLTLTLLLQGLFYFKNSLAQDENYRGLVVSLCGIFSCDVPLRNDARQGKKSIVMLSHAISRVKNKKDQLRIKAIFTNKANYTQSYPILSIKMTDASEKISAMRRFQPQEYLAPHINIKQGLPAATSVEIFIDIIKPSSPVVSYQFDFL